jgi:hypothetical protein
MAIQKLRPSNKRTGLNGGQTGKAKSPGRTKAQRSGVKQNSANKSAHPKTNFDRYIALARAAAASGDEIESENYYQHAEHYFRLMKALTA